MLACARIGAIHSVVFAGMDTRPALAHRRLGLQGHRRHRLHLPTRQEDLLKPTVDERCAISPSSSMSSSIAAARGRATRPTPSRASARSTSTTSSRRARSTATPSRWTRRIPSSSSTPREPQASRKVSCTLPAATWSASPTFARLLPERRARHLLSTSDIGWIVGHSFIVYGPLSVGATVFCREDVPDYPTPEVTWS